MKSSQESHQFQVQGSAHLGAALAESSHIASSQNANPYMQNAAGVEAASSSPKVAPLSTSPHRVRRRNRMITQCLECRRRKLKCDKLHPCTNCTKFVRDCVFLAPALDSTSQLKLAEMKEKMGVLERGLEAEVANAKKERRRKQDEENARVRNEGRKNHQAGVRKSSIEIPGEPLHERSDEDELLDVPEDEKNLEPTPLAVADVVHDVDDDVDDDILDLGVKMGKMRMTERIGGYFRPKLPEELLITLFQPTGDDQSSRSNQNAVPPVSPLTPSHPPPEMMGRQSFLEPGPTYLAPGSGFLFGSTGTQTSVFKFLPPRPKADRLIKQYHHAVHFIARVVHWPSFETQYDKFWTNITQGNEPPGSLQAVVFAVLLSAVVSMNTNDITTLFSAPKSVVMASFQMATELALGKANFLRTTKLETLQALVIYLIPMCRDEMSRAHSVLVGTAIRLAECMGLQRDPQETYLMEPLESHVRRTVWYQLCFLDVRTAEAQGPRPSIRRDDFDCAFPLNIDDADVLSGNPEESNVWTDMTFSKIRFECNEMHRVIWVDRIRLEKKQVTLTHILGKIESFRKAMEEKYHPILNENFPIQRNARLVMDLLLRRMHIMVLHRYHNSSQARIPDRLRQIILTTGTQQMEAAVSLETDPVLQPWAWYCGAYQQWHTALLLLTDVFAYPMSREADRIWRILDYVFETDTSMTREQKGRTILSTLIDRAGAYRDSRKIRAPVKMISRINATPPPTQGNDSRIKSRLNFNSDPAPPLTRSTSGPLPQSHRPSHRSVEARNLVFTAQGSPSPTPSNHSQQGQINSQLPFGSSHALPLVATSSLGHLTQAFADVPSPTASAAPPLSDDQNWTFDAPSSFFMRRFPITKPTRAQLPGEQPMQISPPASEATTGSSDYYVNPGQGANPAVASSHNELAGGRIGYPIPPPPEIDIGPWCYGGLAPSGGDGMAGSKNSNVGSNPKNAGPAVIDPDAIMVDIDWSEWDKIFPPDTNTNNSILDTPLPAQF